MQRGCNKIAVKILPSRDTSLFTQKLQTFSVNALPQDRGNLPDQNIPLLRGRDTVSVPALQP